MLIIQAASVHSSMKEKQRKYKEVSVFLYGAVRISVPANSQDGQMLKAQKCKSLKSKSQFLFLIGPTNQQNEYPEF